MIQRLGCLGALVTCFGAGEAQAYVRTRSKSGTPIAWRVPQVELHVVDPSPAFDTSVETFTGVVERSAAVWSHDAIVCSDIHLTVASEHLSSGVVRNDGVAMVMVSENGWSHKLEAIALTTVFLRNVPGGPEDGEILDADVEFNAAYTWADIPDGQEYLRDYANDEDLGNALVHELGHLLGLWHNCHGDDEEPLPDDQGNPSPDCLPAVAPMVDATMYPSTDYGRTDKRTLSNDELKAACDIYPYTYRLEGNGCALSLAGSTRREASARREATPGSWFAWDGMALAFVLSTLAIKRRRSSSDRAVPRDEAVAPPATLRND